MLDFIVSNDDLKMSAKYLWRRGLLFSVWSFIHYFLRLCDFVQLKFQVSGFSRLPFIWMLQVTQAVMKSLILVFFWRVMLSWSFFWIVFVYGNTEITCHLMFRYLNWNVKMICSMCRRFIFLLYYKVKIPCHRLIRNVDITSSIWAKFT